MVVIGEKVGAFGAYRDGLKSVMNDGCRIVSWFITRFLV